MLHVLRLVAPRLFAAVTRMIVSALVVLVLVLAPHSARAQAVLGLAPPLWVHDSYGCVSPTCALRYGDGPGSTVFIPWKCQWGFPCNEFGNIDRYHTPGHYYYYDRSGEPINRAWPWGNN